MMNQDEWREEKLKYYVTYYYPSDLNVSIMQSFVSQTKEIDIDTFVSTAIPEGAVGYMVIYGSCGINGGEWMEQFRVFRGKKLLTFKEAKAMFPNFKFEYPIEEMIKAGLSSKELYKKVISMDDLPKKFSKFVETCKALDATEEDLQKYFANLSKTNPFPNITEQGMVLLPNVKLPEYLEDNDFVIFTND